jgi:hypothetical protein
MTERIKRLEMERAKLLNDLELLKRQGVEVKNAEFENKHKNL